MTDVQLVSEIMSQNTNKKANVVFSSVIPEKTYKYVMENMPESYKKELNKALNFLKEKGCKEVYLFGSLVTGKIHENTDIDIGIKGVPDGKYLSLYADLMFNIKIPFDLLDFDCNEVFFNSLKQYNEIIKIG